MDRMQSKGGIEGIVQEVKNLQFQLSVKFNIKDFPSLFEKGERKANGDHIINSKLVYVPLPNIDDTYYDELVGYGWDDNYNADWEVHPDGDGILHPWHPKEVDILLLVDNDKDELSDALTKIYDRMKNERQGLDRKIDLGELDKSTRSAEIRKIKIKARDSYMALLDTF
jgi:hypothetical protein